MKKADLANSRSINKYTTATLLPKATRNSNKPSPNVIIQRIYQVAPQPYGCSCFAHALKYV